MSLLNQYLKKIGEEEPKAVTAAPLPSMLKGRQQSRDRWGSYKVISLVLIPAVLIGAVAWYVMFRKPVKEISSKALQARSDGDSEKRLSNPSSKVTSAEQGVSPVVQQNKRPAVGTNTMPSVTIERLASSKPEIESRQTNNQRTSLLTAGTTPQIETGELSVTPEKTSVSAKSVPVDQETDKPGKMVIEKQPMVIPDKITPPVQSTVPNTQKAAAVVQKVSASPPREMAQNYYQLGLSALQDGNLAASANFFNHMLAISPNNIDGLLNLSNVYIRQGRFDAAIEALNNILKIDPTHYKSLDNLGFIAIQRDNTAEAKKYFNKALSLNPSDEIALGNLAYIAQNDNSPDEAITYYEKLVSINPLNVDALTNYAHLMSQGRDVDRAIELYSQCLSIQSVQENQALMKKLRQRINLMRAYN